MSLLMSAKNAKALYTMNASGDSFDHWHTSFECLWYCGVVGHSDFKANWSCIATFAQYSYMLHIYKEHHLENI